MTLSKDALYETARSLADRGEDYGWNAYYQGNRIPPASARKIVEQGGDAWLEAFRAVIAEYRRVAGEAWSY